MKKRMNSSISSKKFYCKTASEARNLIIYVSQTAATTFAVFSVFILLLWCAGCRWSACPSSSRRLTVARCARTAPGARCPSASRPSARSCPTPPGTGWWWPLTSTTAWSADSSAGMQTDRPIFYSIAVRIQQLTYVITFISEGRINFFTHFPLLYVRLDVYRICTYGVHQLPFLTICKPVP